MFWFKLPQRSMLCGEYLEEPLGCLRSPQIAVIPAVYAALSALGAGLARGARRAGWIPTEARTAEFDSDMYVGNFLRWH